MIACIAVNPGSGIGCGSPRLILTGADPEGFAQWFKGKETQTHVRQFSGLYILG